MLIKTDKILIGYEGQSLKNDNKDLDVKAVIMAAMNYIEDAKLTTVEEKVRIYDISKKMMQSTEIEFSIEDLALIKKNINKIFSPVVVGQMVEILEKK